MTLPLQKSLPPIDILSAAEGPPCGLFRPPAGGGIFLLTIMYYLYKLLFMHEALSLDATFSALADPTRRAILARLAQGEATVMELAEPFAMTQPAISQHLKVLED